MLKDIWTNIDWNDVNEIGLSAISVSGLSNEEHAVRIRGKKTQRIVCMTPNREIAELITELLIENHENFKLNN